jgi:hypothetical protein
MSGQQETPTASDGGEGEAAPAPRVRLRLVEPQPEDVAAAPKRRMHSEVDTALAVAEQYIRR